MNRKRQKKFQEITKHINRNRDYLRLPVENGRPIEKWGEDAVNLAIQMGDLTPRKCITKNLKAHGYAKKKPTIRTGTMYMAATSRKINVLKNEDKENATLLHPKYTFTVAHVIWAVREEQAQSVEDVFGTPCKGVVPGCKSCNRNGAKSCFDYGQRNEQNRRMGQNSK